MVASLPPPTNVAKERKSAPNLTFERLAWKSAQLQSGRQLADNNRKINAEIGLWNGNASFCTSCAATVFEITRAQGLHRIKMEVGKRNLWRLQHSMYGLHLKKDNDKTGKLKILFRTYDQQSAIRWDLEHGFSSTKTMGYVSNDEKWYHLTGLHHPTGTSMISTTESEGWLRHMCEKRINVGCPKNITSSLLQKQIRINLPNNPEVKYVDYTIKIQGLSQGERGTTATGGSQGIQSTDQGVQRPEASPKNHLGTGGNYERKNRGGQPTSNDNKPDNRRTSATVWQKAGLRGPPGASNRHPPPSPSKRRQNMPGNWVKASGGILYLISFITLYMTEMSNVSRNNIAQGLFNVFDERAPEFFALYLAAAHWTYLTNRGRTILILFGTMLSLPTAQAAPFIPAPTWNTPMGTAVIGITIIGAAFQRLRTSWAYLALPTDAKAVVEGLATTLDSCHENMENHSTVIRDKVEAYNKLAGRYNILGAQKEADDKEMEKLKKGLEKATNDLESAVQAGDEEGNRYQEIKEQLEEAQRELANNETQMKAT
ncbi:hypothetical protein BDD12DRAFT_809528 [Trichophaea hybrida]|nr:hypothetical protein BDD12DRAFT_809528 [Trichophaea hybrida]